MNNHELLEIKIAKFLRFGVFFAAAIMFISIVFKFNLKSNMLVIFEAYDPIPLQDMIMSHFYHKRWIDLIAYVGLFILILLPITRVIFTAILFLKLKETKMAALAIFVSLSLILSFVLGIEL